MNENPAPVLRAENLTLGYPKTDAVIRNVSIALRPGRLFAVAGPNGAGKSTLLAALAGIIVPRQGTVSFKGAPLLNMSRKERARRIGYLPQNVRPSASYTVRELVYLGRFAHGTGLAFETPEDAAAMARALEQTRTTHLSNRLFQELSGGERQRVLTASVLSGEPEVILLDEPTASLDISGSAGVFNTLRRLAEDGRTVGVVTHDLNLAGQYADAMVLLADGGIAEAGPPETVLRQSPLERAYGGGFQLLDRPGSRVKAVLPHAADKS